MPVGPGELWEWKVEVEVEVKVEVERGANFVPQVISGGKCSLRPHTEPIPGSVSLC